MFVRTRRLTLRPGWIEDAPALAQAVGHRAVVEKLASLPFPYTIADAEAFLTAPRAIDTPSFLMFEHRGDTVRLVGGIGVDRRGVHGAAGDLDLGYWVTPDAWGRGLATEAGLAVVATLRATLRVTRLVSGHFADNPASGRVLAKIGFRPTGLSEKRWSQARGCEADCVLFELDDGAGDTRLAA
ncbi:GNAT family N-acetyltransferase [Sphingomonas japonica]|uniref:RimJ/RimL family protein N-acetyltransferase n=1 Tax=Sphingomonas japonica TaxID=511662 RepID=A0ABX0TWU6_9SPHN|nr:GNAT family N-acetyltransferase [Sphingomonas japonica]NIJ22784.1 RimJ/RimL family protein N-acetyltransferase [Sphingomonas japonica]